MNPTETQNTCAAIAGKLSKLPPFGPAVLKLLSISLDDESAPTSFEEVFKSDPALTAELLVMANSAAYGGRSRVQTIGRAIRYLGLEQVRSMAATSALRSHTQRASTSPIPGIGVGAQHRERRCRGSFGQFVRLFRTLHLGTNPRPRPPGTVSGRRAAICGRTFERVSGHRAGQRGGTESIRHDPLRGRFPGGGGMGLPGESGCVHGRTSRNARRTRRPARIDCDVVPDGGFAGISRGPAVECAALA